MRRVFAVNVSFCQELMKKKKLIGGELDKQLLMFIVRFGILGGNASSVGPLLENAKQYSDVNLAQSQGDMEQDKPVVWDKQTLAFIKLMLKKVKKGTGN